MKINTRIIMLYCMIWFDQFLLAGITSTKMGTQKEHMACVTSNTHYLVGLENIHDPVWQKLGMQSKDKLSIGLITNQTGKDSKGRRTIDLLLARGLAIKRIFAPEHGIEGTVNAEKEVHDTIDSTTGIPVVSLYGKGSGKRLAPHKIKDLDILIFDMQDCGMRHYTYISTLLHCMETASHHEIPFVVLDRPNPLGIRMEGPVCEPHSKSFIAAAPIPLRHGMTIGELARYFNVYVLEKKVKLHVVSLHNYERHLPITDALFSPLSPNIPSLSACYGYSFLGLLGEVRPFDCGLGTDHAMASLGFSVDVKFPDKKWIQLQKILQQSGLKSEFHTYYSARKKKMCRGLKFDIQDINTVASYEALTNILKFFSDAGISLKFSKLFDIAVGSSLVREYVQGVVKKSVLDMQVADKLTLFSGQAQQVYLYKPWPQVH